MNTYCRRYRLYACAHGRTPEQQVAADPHMAPYARWITDRLRACRKARPDLFCGDAIADHDAVSDWIEATLCDRNQNTQTRG